MALRNIWSQTQNQFQVGSIDADVIELNDVPISGGGGGSVGSLSQVLATGSNGNNQSITNLNGIQMNGYLQLTNNTINTVQLNTGTNSWQLVSSNGEFFIQNYVNSSLVSSSFQIDNDGNVLIGNTQTTTPYLYVMGGNGPGRVYDTIYNPLPSNPSGSSIVYYNQDYNILSINENRTVVNNSTLGKFFIVLETIQINNYPDATHYLLNINTITCTLTNLISSTFHLQLALISNRNTQSTSAITQSDLNKNIISPMYLNLSYVNGQAFSISDLQIEFYDNTGINNMQLVAYTNSFNNLADFEINSIDMNVRCDNSTYNLLPDITS